MEIRDLAAAVQDDNVRGVLLDGMSAAEAGAFDAYVSDFEASELELKKDKIL